MKKLIFTCILSLGLAATGFAQSEKLIEKANEKVEELNSQILAGGDDALALTDAQKEQIQALHIERFKELRKATKAGGDKEGNKVINKKYFQKIHKEILTKEQMKAKRKGKEQNKE